MVKVITAAATLSGDIDKAIYWFRNEPIADYDHKTAAELVAQGHSEAVLAYLCDLENGARAGETRRPAARARRSTAAGSTGRGSRRCICRARRRPPLMSIGRARSITPPGTNLVVFNADLRTNDSLAVHDPEGRLPKDQSSWPAS